MKPTTLAAHLLAVIALTVLATLCIAAPALIVDTVSGAVARVAEGGR